MERLEYSIQITASQEHVWNIMLGDETYAQWVKAFSENSLKKGDWKQGTYMDFIDPGMGGTRALLDVVDEPNRMVATHIASLSVDNEVDTQSKAAKKWIGTVEEYILTQDGESTTLRIIMQTHHDFVAMFDKCWPHALQLLKELCEK